MRKQILRKTIQCQISIIKETKVLVRCQWLMPVILTTQEAEIRRTSVQGQSRQIVHEISPKISNKK
jgi:hypothetical protein